MFECRGIVSPTFWVLAWHVRCLFSSFVPMGPDTTVETLASPLPFGVWHGMSAAYSVPLFLWALIQQWSSRGLVAGHKKACQGKDMSNPTCAQLHTA